jgi:hypothetical protein
MQHAHAFEPVQEGRIYIEKLSSRRQGHASAGLALAIERGWLTMHESGTFVRFTQFGADLFA